MVKVMKNKTNCENKRRVAFIRNVKPIRWIHEKRAKFALNIITLIRTLRMHVFDLKCHIHTHIT